MSKTVSSYFHAHEAASYKLNISIYPIMWVIHKPPMTWESPSTMTWGMHKMGLFYPYRLLGWGIQFFAQPWEFNTNQGRIYRGPI